MVLFRVITCNLPRRPKLDQRPGNPTPHPNPNHNPNPNPGTLQHWDNKQKRWILKLDFDPESVFKVRSKHLSIQHSTSKVSILTIMIPNPNSNPLHHCITACLHHLSLRHCITASLHHCITASLHHCITASVHHCITASLHHCNTASLPQ